MRVISYGGGVQSTALLVLAVRGDLGPVDAALFANVGDDSEDPDTLRYVRDYAVPLGHLGGVGIDCNPRKWRGTQVPVLTIQRTRRDGTTRTLYADLMSSRRSIDIPARMPDSGAPGNRNCTAEYKLKVVDRWLARRGAVPSTVLIGFSWDEAERMGNGRKTTTSTAEYPLIDRRLTRDDCKRIIERAGLPLPPKSSCYFCPYRKPSDFARMRRDRPALFWKAADLERVLIERRAALGKDPVYLTRFGRPLAEAIGEELQTELDFGTGPGETCDEGYCWT